MNTLPVHLMVNERLTLCRRTIPEFPVKQADGTYAPTLRAHRLLSRVTCAICLRYFRGEPVTDTDTIRIVDMGD